MNRVLVSPGFKESPIKVASASRRLDLPLRTPFQHRCAPEYAPGTVPAKNRIQLLLVSSNRLLRESLARLLRKKEEIYVAGVMLPGPNMAGEIAAKRGEVLLLDDYEPELDGQPSIRELLQSVPGLKIILLGMEENESRFLEAVREGAVGYLLQEASAAEVVAAVRAVMRDEAVCPPRLCGVLFRQCAQQSAAIPNLPLREEFGLTRRQQQLMPLIADGLTNKEIASALNLSEQTVKNHIHRMLQTSGAGDRLAMVELCRNRGHLL